MERYAQYQQAIAIAVLGGILLVLIYFLYAGGALAGVLASVILGWTGVSSIFIVRPVRFGVEEILGRRTNRVLQEGVNLIIPFVTKVTPISLELAELPVSAVFTTQDKLELTYKGSLQFNPDPRIQRLLTGEVIFVDEREMRRGRNVFFELSVDVIANGIAERIESLLGAIGGTQDADSFIKRRGFLNDLVNCFLRFSILPHEDHCASLGGCNLKNCKWNKGGSSFEVPPPKKLLKFYEDHWAIIHPIVEGGRGREVGGQTTPRSDDEPSFIEKLYGISVSYFATSAIAFTAATTKALEEKKQAAFRVDAVDQVRIAAKKMKDDLGVDGSAALTAVQLTTNPNQVSKQGFAFEGVQGVVQISTVDTKEK